MLALAEVGWSNPAHKSYTDFHCRALKEVDWLQSQGYHTFSLKDEIGDRPETLQMCIRDRYYFVPQRVGLSVMIN